MHQESPPPNASSGNARQLEIVVTRTMEGWFPTNGTTLTAVKENFRSGAYQQNRSLLVADLKTDLSLFLYCLKELVELARKASSLPIDPSELFYALPLDVIERVLSVDESAVSPHQFSSIDAAKAERLKEALISASVAESLSTSGGDVPPDAAYCVSLLRQLGLTLVAWNYPHVYTSALAAARSVTSLDVALNEMLGFSPTLLGIAIARQWGLSPTVLVAMGDQRENGASVERAKAERLQKICETGELFAQLQDPRLAQKRGRWQDALAEMAIRLGPDASVRLKATLARFSARYVSASPILCHWEMSTAAVDQMRESMEQAASRNTYIRHCPPALREALLGIYRLRQPSVVSKELLERVIREAIPLAGFSRGCIYLVEPESMRLAPRLPINAQKGDFEPVSISASSVSGDPLALAYRSNSPVQYERPTGKPIPVLSIAGVLGEQQRAGVLYLELSPELIEDRRANPIVLFKALRLTLSDLLMIK